MCHSFRPPPTLSGQSGHRRGAIGPTPPEAYLQPAYSCCPCNRRLPPSPAQRKKEAASRSLDSLRAPVPLSLLWTPFSHPTTVRAWRAVP